MYKTLLSAHAIGSKKEGFSMSESSESKSGAAVPLPRKQKNRVQWGCVCLMLSIAMFGLSLATLQEPILREMDAMQYFSLLSILSTLGLAIMTPIGGKLGDLFGRRNLVLVSGLICAACGIGMSFIRALWPFMLLRLLLGAAQGAFTAAPYILVREINEPKDVPKAMGLLASAVALGSFGGSLIAGFLTDLGQLELAILFPVLPLLIGVGLIAAGLPNTRREAAVSIDVPGILALTISLSASLLALNAAPRSGWLAPGVLVGFAIGIAALFWLIRVEKTAQEPLIPLHLFRNSHYNALLWVSFLSYFYYIAMNYYTPLAVLQVLGGSTAVSGSLQLPRTVLIIALPALCGLWVSKQPRNNWIALAVSTGLVAVAFLVLGFTSPATPVLLFYLMLALTGVAESLRAVSLTPSAQATLELHDLGVGTSLINFANSLSSLIASAFLGILYDTQTAANGVAAGVNIVSLSTAAISLAGFLLVVLVVRRHMERK